MDDLFKRSKFSIVIPVKGETDDYEVKIVSTGFLDELHKQMALSKKFDVKTILKTLTGCFDREDIYMSCSCPDFCLDENTKIKLLNNQVKTVKELKEMFDNGEELWVYSTDENGDFKPGKVNSVWISGYTQDMIKVTLDNGESVITTPNHRFMLRNGEYEEAQNLKEGQSLMPLYFKIDTKGYEEVKINSTTYPTKFESVYKRVANDVLKEEVESVANRAEDNQVQIHHMDFNKLNNYPSNLKPMGRLEHWHYHCDIARDPERHQKWRRAGEKYNALVADHSTPEYLRQAEICRNNVNKYYAEHTQEEISQARREAGVYNDEWKKKIGKGNHEAWENYTEEEYKKRCAINYATNHKEGMKELQSQLRKDWYKEHPEHIETCKKNVLKAQEAVRGVPKSAETKEKMRQARLNEEPEHRQKRIENFKLAMSQKTPEEIARMSTKNRDSRMLRVIKDIYSNGEKLTNESYKRYKRGGDPNIEKFFSSIDEMKSYFNVDEQFNHKIIKIERIRYEEPKPVYDIEVEKYNNFYVDAGIILHNCYRYQYWASRNKYNSGPNQPSNGKWIRNPDDSLGSGCKHCLLVLSNNSWILPCCRVIYNYVTWMEEHKQQMYAEQIYPAIYEKEYEDGVQLDLLATDELGNEDEIKAGNIHKGRDTRGRFTSEQEPGQFKKKQEPNNTPNNDTSNEEEGEEEQ